MLTRSRLLTSVLALLVWPVRAAFAETTCPIEAANTSKTEKREDGKMI